MLFPFPTEEDDVAEGDQPTSESTTGRKRTPRAAAATNGTPEGTPYAILKGVKVTVEQVKELGLDHEGAELTPILWVRVPGIVYSKNNREHARTQYVNSLPEGEGKRTGIWKAVSVSAFDGGSEGITEVTKPVTEREKVDA